MLLPLCYMSNAGKLLPLLQGGGGFVCRQRAVTDTIDKPLWLQANVTPVESAEFSGSSHLFLWFQLLLSLSLIPAHLSASQVSMQAVLRLKASALAFKVMTQGLFGGFRETVGHKVPRESLADL